MTQHSDRFENLTLEPESFCLQCGAECEDPDSELCLHCTLYLK